MKQTALILAVLAAAPALATTYYVAQSGGNDGYNGLSATLTGGNNGPFLTCNRAGEVMMPGDTTCVRNGRYIESTWATRGDGVHAHRDGTSGSPITFRNYPGEVPIVDANLDSCGFGGGRNWQVRDGFKVFHGASDYFGNVLIMNGNYWLVQNCHISNQVSTYGHENCVRIEGFTGGPEVVGTVIRNCKIEDDSAIGIQHYNTRQTVIENNEVLNLGLPFYDKDGGRTNFWRRNYSHDCSYYGWLGPNQFDFDRRPCFKYIYENIFDNTGAISANVFSSNCFAFNNTVYRSGGFRQSDDTRLWYYWNNILIDAATTGAPDGQYGSFLSGGRLRPAYSDYNCHYPTFGACIDVYGTWESYDLAGWRSTFGYETHAVTSDPRLVNPAGNDFHLQTGSPCRGTGVRYWNDATADRDMGAYPFGNTTVVGLLPSGTPTIAIVTPQGAGTYITTNSTVSLTGTASDDVAVTSVTWNCSTDGSGTAAGTTSWSVANIPLQPGNNIITITARDGDGNSAGAVLTVEYRPLSANQSPVANAGSDQSVTVGGSVVLDGRASYDPDNWPAASITYSWTRVSGPSITLFGATSAQPSFIANAEGVVVLQLSVYDGAIYSTDQVSITVVPVGANLPPTADAGEDAIGVVGTAVNLDGTGSDDPDHAPSTLTYAWTQVSGPSVTFGSANTATPWFLPSVEGIYVFRLTVSDGTDQTSDTVSVTVNPVGSNLPPTAEAGPDQNVVAGATVRLDARASSDPDEDVLSYAWTQVSGPSVEIFSADQSVAFAEVGEPGSYIFRVTVSDGEVTDADTVAVEAVEATNDGDTGGDDAEAADELELWPNRLARAEATAVIVVGPAALDGVKALVFTVVGKSVGEVDLAIGETLERAEGSLDAAALPAGVYLVTAGSGATVYLARLVVE